MTEDPLDEDFSVFSVARRALPAWDAIDAADRFLIIQTLLSRSDWFRGVERREEVIAGSQMLYEAGPGWRIRIIEI